MTTVPANSKVLVDAPALIKPLRDADSRYNAVVDIENRCPSVIAEGFKIDPVDAAPHLAHKGN